MDIRIPDIGDFADVPVIEVHVAPGDTVAAEDPLITLESDKATMDIPAPAAGTVSNVVIHVGALVSAGDLIVRLTEELDSAAWAGITETEARAAGVTYGKGVFPWAASGRSLTLGRSEGLTKVLFDQTTGRATGCGIVGPSAGDLIAEAALAIEMGADAADVGLTIHPHPTLSETVAMAAEAFEGTITDLYLPRR